MQQFAALILAGGVRRSPLCDALGRHVLTLPISERRTLLGRWLERLGSLGQCFCATIVVSTADDATQVRDALQEIRADDDGLPATRVIVDPAPYRGTAGVLRDLETDLDAETLLIGEAVCVPPPSMTSLLEALVGDTPAVVGLASDLEPAGLYAIRRSALAVVPTVGFFDFKEQLLPALHDSGQPATVVRITDSMIRLRDRDAYLAAVSAAQADAALAGDRHRRARSRSVLGASLVRDSAIIEDDALVHESVVLDGARLETGAVVSRCVVGYGATVPAGQVLRETLVDSAEVDLPGSPSPPKRDQYAELLS